MSQPSDNAPVFAYEPNCQLKQELGEEFSLEEAISEEQLRACEALVDQAAEDFFAEASSDLRALAAMTHPAEGATDYEQLLMHAYNIKSLAKVLGFTLITDVCMHLVGTVHSQKLSETQKQAMLNTLVDALAMTFDHRIRDDGGTFGRELRAKLTRSL